MKAIEAGSWIAELVRQGVDRILAEIPLEEDPLLDIIGIVKSGPSDLSERHDEYLTRWLLEDNAPENRSWQ